MRTMPRRAVSARTVSKKPGSGAMAPAVADRFENHRGEVVAVLIDRGSERVDVVKRRDDDLFRAEGGRPALSGRGESESSVSGRPDGMLKASGSLKP